MNKENVQAIIDAPSCRPELKKIAMDWMNNVATDEELIEAVKEYIQTIDGLIAFTESEMGKAILGEEKITELNKQAKEAKEKGEKYCVCPACQACKRVLEEI